MKRPTNFSVYKEWEQFGKRITALMREKDYRGIAAHYYEVADFLESRGKEASDVGELGRRALLKLRLEELQIMQRFDPALRLKVFGAESCCVECNSLNQKTTSIEEARLQKLLPRKRCSAKFGCRCAYVQQLEQRHANEWTAAIQNHRHL
jgi:hypothetical protein